MKIYDDFIRKHEGLRLRAYLCEAGVPTIGWGTTIYPNGRRVKLGDVITKEQADAALSLVLRGMAAKLRETITVKLNDNQFNAILSLVYNIGIPAFSGSTLRRLVNKNPNDPKIADAFKMWRKVTKRRRLPNGQIEQYKVDSRGLINRRADEVALYFKPME